MSDLTERISAVLREVIRTELGLRSGEYFPSAVFDKAAAAVAEALQLTEETKPINDPPVAGLVQSILGYERRWVSGWTTAEETP